MKSYRYQPLLIVFIVIGLIASIAIGYTRHHIENSSRTIDLAIDYEGLLELAEREGLEPSLVLSEAKKAGITSLAVYETTFKKLNKNGKAIALRGADIIASYHAGTINTGTLLRLVEADKIIGTEIYIVGHDKAVFRELKEDLILRLGRDRVTSITLDDSKGPGENSQIASTLNPLAADNTAPINEILAVKDNYDAFIERHLGMPTDEMQAVNDAGFKIVARPTNYNLATESEVEAVFSRLEGFDISAIVFSGDEALGARNSLDTTIRLMKEKDFSLGAIEGVTQLRFYPQEGMEAIARGIGYDKVVRLYSIPKDEQPKLKLADAVERWANTDAERNIRLNLMRIYEEPSPNMTLMETNMTYFAMVRDRLIKDGYAIGEAGLFADYNPPPYLRALVILGVVAATLLYLSLILPWLNNRPKLTLITFAILGTLASLPLFLGAGGKIRLIAAFLSANIFPALAIIAQLDLIRAKKFKADLSLARLVVIGLIALVITSTLSMVGAAYLSGSISDTGYFLEFEVFRGVKLTFILPIILVAIAFLKRFDVFDGRFEHSAGFIYQLREILNLPVKIKTLVGAALVLLAGIVLVARSGHTSGMPVLGLELKFRALLESLFYARPRTKELIIGHPAFMLAVMAVLRKWPMMMLFALVLVATIGQGSMVETFAHMRSPIHMSLVRGMGGVFLGGIIGTLAIIMVYLWQRIMDKITK